MNPAVQPSRTSILAALDRVKDPKTGKGLSAAGLVQGLVIGEGKVGFMIEVAAAEAAQYAPVREAAERALLAIGGVLKAQVVLTTAAAPAHGHSHAPAASRPKRGGASVAHDPGADTTKMPPAERLEHVHRHAA